MQSIIQKMTEFNSAENRYKDLYLNCPEVFWEPISDWEEFKRRLWECGISAEIPREAPSPIMPWLSEDEFFPHKNLDVSIVRNNRYCPPFWHKLEFIKIVYVVSGSAVMFVKNNRFEIKEGNLCLVSPMVENAEFSCDDGDIVINIIIKRSTFEKSFSSLLMENSRLSDFFWQMLYRKNGNGVLRFRKTGENDLTEQTLQLYRELNLEKEPSNIMLKSYLMLFFGQLLRNYERIDEASEPERKNNYRLSGILQYMNDHKQTVTLPELAQDFYLSEGYLSRYLKRETGKPFNVLLRQIRIEHAAAMLQNSDCSIEEVCGAVGYSDISRFYRNFKAQYGMTPAQFRRINLI